MFANKTAKIRSRGGLSHNANLQHRRSEESPEAEHHRPKRVRHVMWLLSLKNSPPFHRLVTITIVPCPSILQLNLDSPAATPKEHAYLEGGLKEQITNRHGQNEYLIKYNKSAFKCDTTRRGI